MKNILVIDDNPEILEAVSYALDEDYNIETSLHPKKIWDMVESDQIPDLIILDIFLSGVDGREIARELKQNETTANIPIVFISANKNVEGQINTSKYDFLSKPFELKELKQVIEKNLH